MAYQVLPMFTTPEERLGVYLQYLPNHEGDTVDATFDVQLKGTQSTGRRFDVMWSAGMQFVSVDLQNLANGIASDFGAHLMQTKLLEQFMGADEKNIGDFKGGKQNERRVKLVLDALARLGHLSSADGGASYALRRGG